MKLQLVRRLRALGLGCGSGKDRILKGSLPFIKRFTIKEINKATNGFSNIMESGPHGTVYRARFSDGLVCTVKRVRRPLQEGDDTFYQNLEFFGHLHHRHLVRLEGFSEGKDRFLLFDHMENGSLKEFLHDPLKTPLNWRTRLKIAVDVAAALDYLQHFCEPPVCDISVSSNYVLLDENLVAKLSDAGFSDRNNPSKPNVSCSTDKTEERRKDLVFQFGVLLLELITGQSLDEEAEMVELIQQTGYAFLLDKIVDADLGGSYDSKELKSLLVIARLCTRTGSDELISIPQILRYLQGKLES